MRYTLVASVVATVTAAHSTITWIARADSPKAPASPSSAGNKAEKLELNIFPIVGGDSDVGFGFGQASDVARLVSKDAAKESSNPNAYRWRIEDAAMITFKVQDGSVIVPFLDIYAHWIVPRFGPGDRFRIEVRPSYTDERTLGYYGMGNASQTPPDVSDDQRQYRRIHPTLAARLRMRVVGSLFVVVGSSYTHSWLDIAGDSLLARERSAGPPEVRRLLGDFASHGVELLEGGIQYDTRDNETVTRHGQFHEVLARASPPLTAATPYRYVQLNLTSRYYTTLIPRWLSLSFRLVADVLLGTPPFYELARFADTPAIGGGKAVRGIPAQRYHGKVKIFENLEARSELWYFTIKGKPLVLGAALFFDGGRTWTELSQRHPDLDGTGIGLKYGIGAGLRLQQGKTFVVRGDLAWSPDAKPIGGYFSAGQIF